MKKIMREATKRNTKKLTKENKNLTKENKKPTKDNRNDKDRTRNKALTSKDTVFNLVSYLIV